MSAFTSSLQASSLLHNQVQILKESIPGNCTYHFAWKMQMHLPRLEKAKELEASAWLFSSSCAETLALSVFDEVFLFSVSLEYIPGRCPQGELRVATGTTHWHCARLSVRSMTRGILGIHYSNKQKRNYTMQLSTVSLFAVPQLLGVLCLGRCWKSKAVYLFFGDS